MTTTTRRPARTQSQLAWDLAIAMAARLDRSNRNRLFARLGAGETYSAIEELLTRAAHTGYPVSKVLADDIGRWLNGYTGTQCEPRLRVIVAQLRVAESGVLGVRCTDR
jgi:hypothetical protein